MHAKRSFAHRLQTAKVASPRTSVENNGPGPQNNGRWVQRVLPGVKYFTHGLRGFNGAVQRRLATQTVNVAVTGVEWGWVTAHFRCL